MEYSNHPINLKIVTFIFGQRLYILIAKKIDLCKNKFEQIIANVLVRFSSLSLFMFCTQRLFFKIYYIIQGWIHVDLMSGQNIYITIFMILLTLLIYYLYDKMRYIVVRRLNNEKV